LHTGLPLLGSRPVPAQELGTSIDAGSYLTHRLQSQGIYNGRGWRLLPAPATEAPNGRILALTPEPTRRQKFGRKAPHRTIISHTIFCATSISFVVAGALLLVAHPPFNLYGFVIRII